MVMEESAMHHHHESHSPSGGDTPNSNSNTTNVYLVGLEFVRQYYTVLNQGPLYLHRFYSDDSSFVHGVSARDSKVAYGQQEIHKRIQGLNFHNCHAKIRQVDSHETLGNGVVIQVTGELSNNGQPMRRFMQTFVLAPQSPKRYYVRNDIFHYQDEVFCDDENEGEETTGESALDTEEADEMEGISVELNGGSEMNIEGAPEPLQQIPSSLQVELGPCPTTNTNIPRSPPKPVEEVLIVDEQPPVPVVVPVAVVETAPEPPTVVTVSANSESGPLSSSLVRGGGEQQPVTLTTEEDPPLQNNQIINVPNAPKTYANLFKSSTYSNKAAGPPKFTPGPPPQTAAAIAASAKGSNGPRSNSPQFTVSTVEGSTTSPPQISPQGTGGGGQQGGVKGLPPRNPRGQGGYGNRNNENNRGGMDRDAKERRDRLSSRSSTTLNDETGSIDGDRRRPVHTYPDANQLFVGNLPHFVTNQDMKDIFQQFGEVAEVKIQKPTPKSGGLKVPYFCFVVFEEAASAQAAIDRKSEIFMKMQGGGQRRLNVEQKRSQRGGRMGGDDSEGPYNRMDASSPAGNRPSDGNRGGSRTFRGSNRGGGGGSQGDRDGRGSGGGGHNSGRGGGGMNSGGGQRGGSARGGSNAGGNKP